MNGPMLGELVRFVALLALLLAFLYAGITMMFDPSQWTRRLARCRTHWLERNPDLKYLILPGTLQETDRTLYTPDEVWQVILLFRTMGLISLGMSVCILCGLISMLSTSGR